MFCFTIQDTVTVRTTGRLPYPEVVVIQFTETVPTATSGGLTAPDVVTLLVTESVSTTVGLTAH